VAGTSYGGFVAFRMAHLFPERVERVVIANSGVCMTAEDQQELVLRANVSKVPELLLPQTAMDFRSLMKLSIARLPFAIPSFILNDLIRVWI
jgi:pimeloyl-ACP methyl ester carboxylesterase